MLLSEQATPDVEAIAAAYLELEGDEALEVSGQTSDGGVVSLALGHGRTAFVAPMPAAVPDGEAEAHARHSFMALASGNALGPHAAHFIVTLSEAEPGAPLDDVSAFSSLLAAVAETSPSVGVYWADSGATHHASDFVELCREPDRLARLTLWSGLSVAYEADGRPSLLSLGMTQLGLMDLWLVAPTERANEAVELFFDLLSYSVSLGAAPGDGETVGRSADENVPVRWVDSPRGDGKRVWHIELS